MRHRVGHSVRSLVAKVPFRLLAFALTLAALEGFKVAAGFDEMPTAPQVTALTIVFYLTLVLAFVAPNALKKNFPLCRVRETGSRRRFGQTTGRDSKRARDSSMIGVLYAQSSTGVPCPPCHHRC
ncbi:hypothetical protein [Catellatospora coxensis]|uniref:hypothetical protein n=1 Tax=Catellatospora coxensis TaxID=310354 RepID=UPI0019407DF8|nr:hypothetical protein [Catellatospora coxensis]